MAPSTEYTMPSGEKIHIGSVILVNYKIYPLWPCLVSTLHASKKQAHYKFLPVYQGDYSFKVHFNKLQLYNPQMTQPENADEELKSAYKCAEEFYEMGHEKAQEYMKNPPSRPEQLKNEPVVEEKPKSSKRKLKKPERPHDDTEIGGNDGHGEDLFSNPSDDEDNATGDEIEEADSRGKKAKSGIPIRKRIRQMKANEVVFSNALPTEFKSKDQVVLINNPNGPGLWPALPITVSEEKCFAVYELFPRNSTSSRSSRHQSKPIRTTDTKMFAIEEKKINSMIEFAKEHDQKLFEALKDVRCYLQDNLRFEEKTQIDVNFKTQEFFFDFTTNQQDIPIDELHLTTSKSDKSQSTLPKRQLQEQKLIREKFALARENPMWLFNHKIYNPNFVISVAELISDKVKDRFEQIWSGQKRCPTHDLFLKNINNTRPYYPSSYRINGCTGGLISNTDVDTVIDEYCKWIDLSVKLPRMPTTLSKYRYAIEIMIKEAVLYLLCEKKQFTREKAEEFLTDSQDAAFARERGYNIDNIQTRIMDNESKL